MLRRRHGGCIFCHEGDQLAIFTVERKEGSELIHKLRVIVCCKEHEKKKSVHSHMVCGAPKACSPHTMKREVTMSDFASFTPRGGNDQETDLTKEVESVVAAFRGKTDTEMLKAIFDRAVEGKRNGTLTNEQIDAFYAQLSPMLDGLKRRRLKKIVEDLKRL